MLNAVCWLEEYGCHDGYLFGIERFRCRKEVDVDIVWFSRFSCWRNGMLRFSELLGSCGYHFKEVLIWRH